MVNAVLDLCAFVVREGWEQREDEGDYPRSLAQKALAEADALRARVKKAEAEHDLRFQVERERATACKDRDAAIADNARLRAALDRAYGIHESCECPASPCTCPGFDIVRAALLSRPDLGAGMVATALSTPTHPGDVVVLTKKQAALLVRVIHNSTTSPKVGQDIIDLLRGKVRP